MGLMDLVLRSMSREKKEKMMIDMMPLMMEGQDINELMPKMMSNMLKEVTVDDVVDFLARMVNDSTKAREITDTLANSNLMPKMMMKTYRSTLSFDETVRALEESIPEHNWSIPDTRDLQQLWRDSGIVDAPRIRILYLCNPRGGYEITKDDALKAMSVMMPMGLSVYETSEGHVEVAFMNLKMMGDMSGGTVREVLRDSADNLEQALSVVLS